MNLDLTSTAQAASSGPTRISRTHRPAHADHAGQRNGQLPLDDANRRTRLALPNGVTTDYTYDGASLLTGLTYKSGSTTLGTLTYAYDGNGQRTAVGAAGPARASPPR